MMLWRCSECFAEMGLLVYTDVAMCISPAFACDK